MRRIFMICSQCHAEIEADALFCPICGAAQDVSHFCSYCGSELEADALFCANCGKDTRETDEISHPAPVEYNAGPTTTPAANSPVKTSSKGTTITIVILITLILAGGLAYFVYTSLKEDDAQQLAPSTKKSTTTSAKDSLTEDSPKESSTDKADPLKADIVAVSGETCSLEGNVTVDNGNRALLKWPKSISISGLDENGETVYAKDVTSVYINDVDLSNGLLDSIPSNKTVIVKGKIYFVEDSVYLKAKEITDESGTALVVPKKNNSQMPKAASTPNYILPYSDTAILESHDVADLSLQELNYAKNEIYARHGRMFDSPELQSYFNSKSWYRGTIQPGSFSNSMLSDIEKTNAGYLSDLEFSINPGGYPLDTK